MNSSLRVPRSSSVSASPVPSALWLTLGVWLCGALIAAAYGLLARLPVTAIPLFVWTPVLVCVLLLRISSQVRAAVAAVPLYALVIFHSLRALAGAAFLVYEARGLLTSAFALPAAYGDLAVGLLSIPVALAARRSPSAARRAVAAWNLFGLLDIVLVFIMAQRILLFGAGPDAMRAFFLFPMPVIPLFLVPLVFLSHGLIFVRTRRPRTAPDARRMPVSRC
jgi:hypothetical protein